MIVNGDDDQELESLETISLTDFLLTEDKDSNFEDHHLHRNPSLSVTTEDLFEFFNGGSGGCFEEQVMSHAEDMIFGGRLIPTNDQPHHEPAPPETTYLKKPIHPKRSESMRELKSGTNKSEVRQLVRNSHSLNYKRLQRNSRFNYESTSEIHRNGLSNKSCSSRWLDLMIGPAKLPPEMDLRDIRSRQNVLNTPKSLFPISVEDSDRFAVSRVGDHRKTSWGVLGILSCKSSGSVAVTMPSS